MVALERQREHEKAAVRHPAVELDIGGAVVAQQVPVAPDLAAEEIEHEHRPKALDPGGDPQFVHDPAQAATHPLAQGEHPCIKVGRLQAFDGS